MANMFGSKQDTDGVQFCYSGPTPICLIAYLSLFPGQRIAIHLHDCPGSCDALATEEVPPLQPTLAVWACLVDSVNGNSGTVLPRKLPEVTAQSHTCVDIRRAHREE